jgi:hypothetical protein
MPQPTPHSEEHYSDVGNMGAGARVTLSPRGTELQDMRSATICRCGHRLGVHNGTGHLVECFMVDCSCPAFQEAA